MAKAEEPDIHKLTAEERRTQRWARFRMMVKAWRPIQDERLEDYESRFFSTFFGIEDPPEELEDADLCRIFWQGVPEPISIRSTSYEDDFDAPLDNARHV